MEMYMALCLQHFISENERKKFRTIPLMFQEFPSKMGISFHMKVLQNYVINRDTQPAVEASDLLRN
jgi:hypothetical protein